MGIPLGDRTAKESLWMCFCVRIDFAGGMFPLVHQETLAAQRRGAYHHWPSRLLEAVGPPWEPERINLLLSLPAV